MKKIILRKISTLEEAEYPQREKYPDGYEKQGYMLDSEKPKVGEPFYVMANKVLPSVRTSLVTEIISESENKIVFKTINSLYELNFIL